jgi:glycerol kinase
VFDEAFQAVGTSQKEFKQIYPHTGWVEHDAALIWQTQLETAKLAMASIPIINIGAIGITNQRETTVLWNKITGKPIYNAIVWQDRRTSDFCTKLIDHGHSEMVQSKTGLIIDAYFSASKIKWVLDNVAGARKLAKEGVLLFGTIDTWLIWNLTNGKSHITDVSNASRTMLFDIHTLSWDQELLNLFDIPENILPTVVDSGGALAVTDADIFGAEIPLTGIMGDQQSALFGQLCVHKGMVKTTYGTGCFLMLNTGKEVIRSSHKMISTIGWKIGTELNYALEGSVFVGGAVIQWLRDEMKFFIEAAHSELLAEAAADNGGVFFVPALTGLGAPYWDANATGAIFGLTRSTTKANLTRAALESICFQVNDVLNAMNQDVDFDISEIRADGGAAANSLLIQFQSDISSVNVIRPTQLETTALGAAFMASIGLGINTIDSLQQKWAIEKTFTPTMESSKQSHLIKKWNKAVNRSLDWY